jgi:hypothetical protein
LKKSSSDYYFPMLSKKVIHGIAAGLLISIAIACSSALYIPDQNNVPAGSNIVDMQAGRNLYINKCGSCHALVLPEKYSAEQWPSLVDKMEIKSKISPEEKKLILEYLRKVKK